MKLKNVIDHLFVTSLSSLSIADNEVNNIKDKDIRKLVAILNNSLVDLFTRFTLREQSIVVKTFDWKSNYLLDKAHSLIHGTASLKYIIDTYDEPFNNDLIKIIAVYNEEGAQLPMNDPEQWASVFTPKYNVIQFTHPGEGQVFEVAYQASHPILEVLDSLEDTLEQEVQIPHQLLELLSTRVAIDFYSGMSGQEETNKSQVLQQKYERLCDMYEMDNLLGTSTTSSNIKLILRGFP